MKIKHILFSILLLSVISCGPSVYTMQVDMKSPSASGLDLSGRSIGVVYVYGSAQGDSTLAASIAEAVAAELEKAYELEENSIPLYTLPYTEGSNYACKDTLVNLVLSLDHDSIFLLCDPDMEKSGMNVNVFDSMDQKERVYQYQGASVSGDVVTQFAPLWVRENHMIFCYDGSKWIDAATLAVDLDFPAAQEAFMKLVVKGSPDRRASAAYDIAYCCYMQGEYALAIEWLNQSAAYASLPDTDRLRKLITNRKKLNTKR